MITAYLSLGSNLRSPERQLRRGIEKIKALPATMVSQISFLYTNDAIGRKAQPRFCNAVIEIKTTLPPLQLMRRCLAIEAQHQRVRRVRWGARTLDVDILLYGHLKMHHPNVTIPHPRMWDRNFVVTPLLSIAPHLSRPN
jgi:2-amino-4-hydroxy-6-hydroxymethyldihydropteridine diphosphokinase